MFNSVTTHYSEEYVLKTSICSFIFNLKDIHGWKINNGMPSESNISKCAHFSWQEKISHNISLNNAWIKKKINLMEKKRVYEDTV